MTISEVKNTLQNIDKLVFKLPDGSKVPSHFHVTEIGQVNKKFIDCGGTVREEKKANFQLWSSIDIHHRLQAKKLIDIISISEKAIGLEDLEIEVEYQGRDTIGKFSLDFDGTYFQLVPTKTDCLAKDNCGIPGAKHVQKIAELSDNCCSGTGCC